MSVTSSINGLIALAGSGEYLPVMDDVDRYLLAHCGADKRAPRVACLPTAAGQEGETTIERWSRMGVEHFSALGAQVEAVAIVDRAGAQESRWAAILAKADLVYFSGGDPLYLYETLCDTPAWEAILSALARGAVYAGCSAGAMVLGSHLPDMRSLGLRSREAFALLPHSMILPHFDRWMAWRAMLRPLIQSRLGPGDYGLGIDEDTVLVGRPGGAWQVMGRSKVHVITHGRVTSYGAGETVPLPGNSA